MSELAVVESWTGNRPSTTFHSLARDAASAAQNFRKQESPITGDKFGVWSGPNVAFATLPGGAILQFDLSRLTLADFRVMRDHYQINVSLTTLTFLLHQIDWHIECDDKKIASMIEANLRHVWTRLIRAMSQAFWAGYSPIAIEYQNNIQDRQIEINRFKDLAPEDCRVNWDTVPGFAPPGQVQPRRYEYGGIRQRGLSVPIPVENTLWYPLLMENGDYYGRKLLKPAFAPWFFSNLVHLFTNRYFERFGEPLPVGRADFERQFENPDGSMSSGRDVMATILQHIRSRSVVVLPSERDPETKHYDFDVEYLESQMRGLDYETYLSRLDEEMSLGMFTPVMLNRRGESGSYNLGVTHLQCVAPETPVLCADLVYRRADSLKVGDELIGFDKGADFKDVGHNARSYRSSRVEVVQSGTKPCSRVFTDAGAPITASDEHPWLVWEKRRKNSVDGNRNPGLTWRYTRDLSLGDRIAYLPTWEQEDSREAGWLAGMFDGEGCLAFNEGTGGSELTVHQNPGPVSDHLRRALLERGFEVTTRRNGSSEAHRIGDGFFGVMRLLGTLVPERLVAKAKQHWEGRGLRKNMGYELATVTAVEPIGDHPVARLQTSTATFIADGYLVSNTYLWSLNALIMDMKDYLDRFVVERLKAYNFSPNSPRAEWVPRRMGRDNDDTIRAIIVELIKGNKATTDLEELGQALGMTVNEVKQVMAPDGSVTADGSVVTPPPPAVPEPTDPNGPPNDVNRNRPVKPANKTHSAASKGGPAKL